MAGTVLVSGGSGYIAGYLIRQLVAAGWTVHTTVRSLAREAALRQLLAVDDSTAARLRRRPDGRRRLGRRDGRLQPRGAPGVPGAGRRAQERRRPDRAGARRRAARAAAPPAPPACSAS
jgi:nucleoside-diphosphate-sugar epimerase